MASIESCETAPKVVTNTEQERRLTRRLHFACTTTCEKFIQHAKYSRMKKTFRVIKDSKPEYLKAIHDQLCSQMKKNIMEDLDDLCKEHCIDVLLDSLEDIKKKQNTSQHSWRPSGDPQEDLRDHIYPIKQKQKEDLQAVLTRLQISNEELVNEVSVNHAEILHLKECNDDLFKAFSDITSSFTGSNLRNLQETFSNITNAA